MGDDHLGIRVRLRAAPLWRHDRDRERRLSRRYQLTLGRHRQGHAQDSCGAG